MTPPELGVPQQMSAAARGCHPCSCLKLQQVNTYINLYMKDIRFVFSPATALRSWNWLTRTQRELGEPRHQAEAPPEHNPVPQSLSAFWLCQRTPLSNAGVSLQGAVAFKGKTGTRGTCWHHGRPTADPRQTPSPLMAEAQRANTNICWG